MLAARQERHDDGIVDAEVVDPPTEFAYGMTGRVADQYPADNDAERARRLAGSTTPPPPSNLPMPLDQAYEELARINAAAAARNRAEADAMRAAGHARISRPTRRR